MRLLKLAFGLRTSLLPCFLALTVVAAPAGTDPAPPAPPETPREFFNAGSRQLSAGKLREAEASLEIALGSQQVRLQSPALYNLGLVRFGQGVEELKKGPAAKPATARGQTATEQGDAALAPGLASAPRAAASARAPTSRPRPANLLSVVTLTLPPGHGCQPRPRSSQARHLPAANPLTASSREARRSQMKGRRGASPNA